MSEQTPPPKQVPPGRCLPGLTFPRTPALLDLPWATDSFMHLFSDDFLSQTIVTHQQHEMSLFCWIVVYYKFTGIFIMSLRCMGAAGRRRIHGEDLIYAKVPQKLVNENCLWFMQFIDGQHHFSSSSFNENATAVMYEESINWHSGCASAVRLNYLDAFLHSASTKWKW